MFKKLFGGSKPEKEEKPKEVPQQQQQKPISDYQIEFEKTSYQIQQQEEHFEKKIDKYTFQIDKLRAEAKEFIAKKDRKKAEYKLIEIKSLEKYIERAENQKQVYMTVRMQLQHGLENKNAAQVLKNAANLIATVNTEELQDAMEQIQEQQQTQAEIDQLFAQTAKQNQNEEDIDDMFKELENEVQMEAAGKLQDKMGGIPAASLDQNYQQVNNPVQQKQQQQQQQHPQQKQDDAFSNALLDQLAL